ncbi:HERC1 [Symbiodinium natans]|uniref:HERC1 protein n=1 Tax=Symbiodinium natans TaxID=878477 RepID=A0A812VFT7_9DINO|nr:HERC1 [Symbiodinium natans]
MSPTASWLFTFICLHSVFAEAFADCANWVPATTLQRLRQAAAEDEQRPEGSTSYRIDKEWNSFRKAERLVRKWGLKWNIKTSYYEYNQDVIIPYFSPRDIVRYLLQTHPELLFGGATTMQQRKQTLTEFWAAFKGFHSSHEVYTTHGDYLDGVVPLLWHGDDGRGVRKGTTTLCTIETPFGLDAFNPQCEDLQTCCKQAGVSNRILQQQNVNLKRHSFLTKFLLFAVPKKYTKCDSLLQGLCAIISRELRALFYEGVVVQGRLWFGACVGCKGDLAWYQKLAELSRCFNKVVCKDNEEMCHECKAGSAARPFEDISSSPSWGSTIFAERPWTQPPTTGLLQVPCDRAAPERILRRDIFHNTKVGCFQDFIASSMLLVADFGYFNDGNANARDKILERMHGHFRLFCLATGPHG